MQRISTLTVTVLLLWFGVTLLGAYLVTTYSDLLCPDWPTCYGQWIPLPSDMPADAGFAYFEVMIEWTHRLIFYIFFLPLIIIVPIYEWRTNRQEFSKNLAFVPVLLSITIFNLLKKYTLSQPKVYMCSSLIILLFIFIWIDVKSQKKIKINSFALKVVINSPYFFEIIKEYAKVVMFFIFIFLIAYSPSMNFDFNNIFDLPKITAIIYTIAVFALTLFIWISLKEPPLRTLAQSALVFLVIQVGLEVLTAVLEAPTILKILHQANALLLSAAISWLYARLLLSMTNFVYSGQESHARSSTTT